MNKTRILFIPIDKINIPQNTVNKDVITIKYNYDTAAYNNLITQFTKTVRNNNNIKSIGIITPKVDNIISFVTDEYIDFNGEYDNKSLPVTKFESWIQYMYTALNLINNKPQTIQFDIIAGNIVCGNLLSTISKNVGIIINTSRTDIYNYNCVLDYSTLYADNRRNRGLIDRYFTNRIKNLSTNLNIIISGQVLSKSILYKISDLLKSYLPRLNNRGKDGMFNNITDLKYIITAISGVFYIINNSQDYINMRKPGQAEPPNGGFPSLQFLWPFPLTLAFSKLLLKYNNEPIPDFVKPVIILLAIVEIVSNITVNMEIISFITQYLTISLSGKKDIITNFEITDFQQYEYKIVPLINRIKTYINILPPMNPEVEKFSPEIQPIIQFSYSALHILQSFS